jgi:hypothetical protein
MTRWFFRAHRRGQTRTYLLCSRNDASTRRDQRPASGPLIRKTLATGVTAGEEIERYAQTTFGATDLTEILASTESSESDCLLELIFYPDTALCTEYENQWGHTRFSYDDQQRILASLSEPAVMGTIQWDRGTRRTTIELPASIPELFVERLNITWFPPLPLAETLERHLPHHRQVRTQVCLRHAPGAAQWRPGQIDLIRTYVEKMPPTSREYDICLEFLLSILSELRTDQDHFEFLINKKSFYFNALCKAEDFERKRLTTSMEILMLQGDRAAHGNIDQWRQSMRTIDAICNALYGRTRFFREPLNVELESSHFTDAAGLGMDDGY